MVAPAGANRSAVTRRVFSITFGASPGSKVETTPTADGVRRDLQRPLPDATAYRNFASTELMIFTVAIISPSTTGL
jgi:hypothetical protein